MKRTNLVLDEQLLEEVTRVSGERTYSRAVTRAIEDYLRRHRAGRILELAGTGLWEGDLSEMREMVPLTRSRVLLVDTSVWIEVFRKPSRLELQSVADLDEVVTCLPVIQEV